MDSLTKRVKSNYKNRNKRGSTITSSKKDKTLQEQLQSQIGNYETRLRNIGIDPEKEKDTRNPIEKVLNLKQDQNVLFDLFEILNRPQQAAFTAINNAIKGKDAGKGFWEGLTGEKETSGGDILRSLGMEGSGKGNLFTKEGRKELSLSDFLGFGLDLYADPMDYLLAPVKVTSTAGKAVKAADNVSDTLSKGTKLVRTADTVGDTARGISKATGTLNAIGDIGKTTETVWRPANAALLSYVGQGIKKGAKLGDNLITKGLSKLDEKELANLTEAARKAGFDNVSDFAKATNLNLENIGSRAASYAAGKQSLKDSFAQAKTTLGKLRKGVRETEGSNELFNKVFKKYEDDLQDLSYKYILKNNDLSKFGDDISNLKDFLKTDGNTVSKWIRENASTDLAKALKENQNTVARDILNMIQSSKDTSVNAKKVLSQLKKGYSFSGSNESVENLINALNDINKKTGAGIKFSKVNKYDDISKEIADITAEIESGELIGDALKSAQKRLEALQDINPDILERTLKIDDIGTLQKNDPRIKKIFDDLNKLDKKGKTKLNRSWEYTNKELEYLDNLRNNPEFMELVGQHQNVYKDVAEQMKKITGMDYSDIVDRSSYVRKAQGDVGDINKDINRINELIDSTSDEALRQDLEEYRNALQNEAGRGIGGSADKFGSQKYQQPALVANRQYKDSIEKAQKSVEQKLKNLKNQYSDIKKATIESELKELKAIKKGNSVKLEKMNKRITKTGEKIENLDKQISEINEAISVIQNKIDNNIIDKSLKIQDKSLSPRLVKDLTKEQDLVKQYDEITKQLDNIDNLTEKEAKALAKKQRKIGNDLIQASNKARATMDIIDGHVDNIVLNELDSNAKNVKKLIDKNSQLAQKIGKKGEAAATMQETSNAIQDFISNVDTKIKKKTSELKGIDPAKDAIIDKEIRHYSMVKSILDSKAGRELFDLNYYAGLDNFVQNAELTNKTARLFGDTITSGALNDPNMIINAAEQTTGIPKGWQKVSGNKLAGRLEDVQNIIGGVKSDTIKDTIESLKGSTYYMNPRAAQLFGIATSSTAEKNAFLNLIDRANTAFKKLSTLTPGFQLRNYMGNSTNMYLAGMPVKDIVPYQTKATKLLNQTEDLMDKFSKGVKFTAEEQKSWDLLQDFYKGGFSGAGSAVRDLEKVQESIKVGQGIKPVNKLADWNMKLNESADAMNRMAMLMYANDHKNFIQKLGAKDSIQAVKYALMDPSDMSDFEKNVVKKIIPFYTFTKQNLMFQATNIAKNAPRYNRLMKSINKMYDSIGEDNYYKYQKEAMQIPIPGAKDDDGNQLFLKANLPLSDLGEFMSDPLGRTAASLTPVIKAPIEMKTGKSLYTGDDTNYKTLSNLASKSLTKLGVRSQGIENAAQAAETILSNFGLQNVSTNLIRKVTAIIDRNNDNISDQQLWAEIFRSVLQNTKQESVINSGLFDELEQYQAIIKRLKNQGVDVPTMTEINQVNKMKLNRMKNKRARSR